MTSHLVFVYGSLKRGFHNHRVLEELQAVDMGDAFTAERYILANGGAFPYLIGVNFPGIDRHHINGEVYQVDDAGLAALDRLEGHPRFYRRAKILVQSAGEDGSLTGTMAWAYFLPTIASAKNARIIGPRVIAPDDTGHTVTWKQSDVHVDMARADASEESTNAGR